MSVNLLVLIESRLLTDAHMDLIEWLGQNLEAIPEKRSMHAFVCIFLKRVTKNLLKNLLRFFVAIIDDVGQTYLLLKGIL